jgi:mono/diheme cytochrome c family protein
LLLLAVLAAGCDLPGQPKEADRPVPADEVTNFEKLYAMRCAGCHGADGYLGPAPPLNDPLFLAIVPDAELLRVITEGRAVTANQRTPMPAFQRNHGGPLTKPQVDALATGIKTRWPAAASPAGVPPYVAPLGGDQQRGARLFTRACAGCHGSEGRGENNGKALPGGALHDPSFLALISDQALRRIIITGRPDLKMPSFEGKAGRAPDFQPLTSDEIGDLVTLLASWRHSK